MTIFTGDPFQPRIEEVVGTKIGGVWKMKDVTRPQDFMVYNTTTYLDGSAYEFTSFIFDRPNITYSF